MYRGMYRGMWGYHTISLVLNDKGTKMKRRSLVHIG